MVKSLKQQLCVLWKTEIWEFGLILGGCLFGVILLRIIIWADKSVNTYFQMGTIMGSLMGIIWGIAMGASLYMYYNTEISMGCIRKNFFLSYFLVNVLTNLLGVLLLLGLCKAESALYARWFPNLQSEMDIFPYVLKFGVPGAVALSVIAMFIGTISLRFGRKGFWVIWALWMILCIGGPRISDAATEAPDSFFGILGKCIIKAGKAVPGNIWVLLAVMVCLVCFIGSFLMIRKQQVTC